MFDIGWTELLVIGVVALIVIGPKDLPDMFRTLGRFTAKARSMARDFQRAMETAADEAGVKDVANDLRAVTSPKSLGLEKVKEAAAKFEKWDPLKPAPKPAATPALAPSAAPAPAAAAPVAAPAPEPAAHGPATQALADAKAEQRARHAAAVEALRKPAATAPAPAAAAAPATAPAARKPRAAPKTADAGADRLSKAVAASRSATPRKPRVKKSDAGSAES